ncbi:helix-turn-helix domain-containing protein [Marinobacter sp. LN3S78]|uniref:helix-turn-helix domain-containing protein n=1 Tax=Marinobacter sp. LN3S78 TaxID=3382300 RepID=UPI00387ADAA3
MVLRFSAKGKPASAFKEEVQAFYEATSTRVDYAPLGETLPFVDLHIRPLSGGLCVLEAKSSPYVNRLLGASERDADMLKLGLTLKGRVCSGQAGIRSYTDANVGNAVMLAADKTAFISAAKNSHTLEIAVPRERLAPRLGKLDRALRYGLENSPELRLLRTYVASLLHEEADYEASTEASISSHLYDLLNLLLSGAKEETELAQQRGGRAARLTAIKSDIATNLGNPALSIDWIARRHGIGKRFVRNLFYGENTNFTDYVLGMRLDLACSLLTSPCHDGRSITAIALEAGFGDISWFNRTFRRRFSMTPKEMREKAKSDMGHSQAF